MTAAHFIYIPIILIVGIVFGFFLGGRAARDAIAAEKARAEKRAAARAARQASAVAAAPPEKSDDQPTR